MTVDYAHTGTAQANRRVKAERIVAFMRAVRLPAPPTAPCDRRDVERAAEVNRASDETWAVVDQLWGQP